ncbi:HpcH/HpaI aldolase family protein [Microbacterium terregens]|uniref:HpcH/HpaI aldolase/citrate lyase family protein n=1 Tax=Microbacterium terregens TaxID=69363 RepID=A0ABV5T3H8_9MICO
MTDNSVTGTRGFARRLRDTDHCLWGTWVKIPAMETVEMIAMAGYDFVIIDQEHAPLSFESVYRTTSLAQALGLQVLVRVPDRSGSHLQRLLDIGVDGIHIPRISDVAEARRVARQMMFSPAGERGLGTTARAGGWGALTRTQYLETGDSDVMRAVQLEDVAVLEQVEAIVNVPELNGVFLGAGDLALSSGLPSSDPKIEALVDRMLAAAATRGLPCGAAVSTAAQAKAAADRGFRYVMISNDASIFREAVTGIRRELAALASEKIHD